MKKKVYQRPKTKVIPIRMVLLQEASPEHGKAYDDDPQNPGGALSRRKSFWDDDN